MNEGYYKPRKTLMKKEEIKSSSRPANKPSSDSKSQSKPQTNSKSIGGYNKRITYSEKESRGLQKGGGGIGGFIKPQTRDQNPMRGLAWGLFAILIIGIIFILFFFTNALNKFKIGGTGLESQDLEMKISQAQIDKDSIDLKLDINAKDEELVGIKIIVDDGTNFDIFKIELTQEQIENGEIHLDLDKVDGDKVTKILVSPILNTPERKNVIGSVEESYVPKGTDFVNKREINNDPQDVYYPYTGSPLKNQTLNQTLNSLTNNTQNQTTNDTQNNQTVANQTTNQTQIQNQTTNNTQNNQTVANQTTNQTNVPQECYNQNLRICYRGKVYQYNSCLGGWIINQTCSSDEVCSINECINKEDVEPECGNGILESGEYCEVNNLAGEICESFGFISGTLRCNMKCAFDLSECINPASIPQCTSHDSSACYNGDVYWYNSCNQIEEIKQNCELGCQSNDCITSDPECTSASQCNDNNACTSDSCDGSFCTHSTISNCCTSASQCNDNNACTSDGCSNNVCTHTNACSSSQTCVNNVCVTNSVSTGTGFIIDHTDTINFDQIPSFWITKAKNELHIAYTHTSHGSQIISGMDAISRYSGLSGYGYSSTGGTNLLHLEDYYGFPTTHCGDDLSQCDGNILTTTRTFLDSSANQEINVVMWSWCSIAGHSIENYLSSMKTLIDEYEDGKPSHPIPVKFVFMTGHAEGGGEDDSSDSRNKLIRNFVNTDSFCKSHECILFDFSDIENYNPDGNYFLDKRVEDGLQYDCVSPFSSGTKTCTWATEYLNIHSSSKEKVLTSLVSGCSHSPESGESSNSKLNCVLKGEAAWTLWAKLAGWEG